MLEVKSLLILLRLWKKGLLQFFDKASQRPIQSVSKPYVRFVVYAMKVGKLKSIFYTPFMLSFLWASISRSFQKCKVHVCRPKGCQTTSPQSLQPRPQNVWRGAALAAAPRPSWASANPAKQHFIARLWGMAVWLPFGLQSHTIPLWKDLNLI